jgi:hypothetical protein
MVLIMFCLPAVHCRLVLLAAVIAECVIPTNLTLANGFWNNNCRCALLRCLMRLGCVGHLACTSVCASAIVRVRGAHCCERCAGCVVHRIMPNIGVMLCSKIQADISQSPITTDYMTALHMTAHHNESDDLV